MGQGKQAKVLSTRQEQTVLLHLRGNRYPVRDRVMFLLSFKAGMRAKEIAQVTWAMVTDADGNLGEEIVLTNTVAKGKQGGRTIPMHPELREGLLALAGERGAEIRPERPVIFSERGRGLSPAAVTVWFHRLYASLGLTGASSHSGRRTFITRVARKIVEAGGSLRDVQQLAGHANLGTTQRYIEGSSEAKRRVIAMV